MPRQVFVIHGGECFETREAYLEAIKGWQLTLEDISKTSWKKRLAQDLSGFDVYTPEMPNKLNARYEEWKIWFDKLVPYMTEGVVLIGHSMGGIFLAKYLAENQIGRIVASVHLVAAPFYPSEREYSADFGLPPSLERLANQVKHIFLYFSRDDKVVEFSDSARYLTVLPSANLVIFNDRGHFNQESFPELVKNIF